MKPAIVTFLFVFTFSISCSKDSDSRGKSGMVEIYNFKIARLTGPCKIDTSRAELADTPLISNNAIRSYNKKEFEFLVTNEAGEKINRLMDNEALALTVDKELIYYFVNKPIYSSSICPDHISMNHTELNKIRMYIITGNPANPVPDQRNDNRLINALKAQGKLK